MVVDDEEDIRDYLHVLLTGAGYDVVTANHGEQALQLLASSPQPHLMLIDLEMPVLDGWALVDILKKDARWGAMPVLVLSGTTRPQPAGVAASLEKPSSPVDILSAVSRLTGRERRESPRFTAQFPVQARMGETQMSARARDLSRGGVAFESAMHAQVGQRLTLELDLPARGVALVEGEVRHIATAPAGWRIGARFVNVLENRDAIEQAIGDLAALEENRPRRP
jgi:CheY-like chemotaxis protein